MYQKILDFIYIHPRRAFLVVAIGIFFLLCSEKSFYPTLSTTQVRHGQNLDYFLHKTFNGSHDYAYAALYHIRKAAPSSFDVDYLQANYGFQKNGYAISIKRSTLTISAPNNQVLVDRLPILPEHLTNLFYRQAIFYNIFLAICCLMLVFLVVQAPVEGLLKLGRKIALTIPIMPFLLLVFVPMLFFIVFNILIFITSLF
jgi:hypothetical protein